MLAAAEELTARVKELEEEHRVLETQQAELQVRLGGLQGRRNRSITSLLHRLPVSLSCCHLCALC